MSAELLREAAKVLRGHATCATSSPPEEPWTAFERDLPGRHVICVERRAADEDPEYATNDRVVDLSLDAPGDGWEVGQAAVDARYIALMHPPVALALAEWLDFEAEREEWFLDGRGGGRTASPRGIALAREILRRPA